MEDFGAFVKAQREARGWTLRHAADLIKVTHSRLAEIERGTSYRTASPSRPSREVIERMAQVYGLPVELLLAHAGYPAGEGSTLSDTERQVLLLFGALTPERQAIAIDILRALSLQNANK